MFRLGFLVIGLLFAVTVFAWGCADSCPSDLTLCEPRPIGSGWLLQSYPHMCNQYTNTCWYYDIANEDCQEYCTFWIMYCCNLSPDPEDWECIHIISTVEMCLQQ